MEYRIEHTAYSLLPAYYQFHADHDAAYRRSKQSALTAPSELIGKACRQMITGDPQTASRKLVAAAGLLDRALPNMERKSYCDPQIYAAARMLSHTIRIARVRSLAAMDIERQGMHLTLAERLQAGVAAAQRSFQREPGSHTSALALTLSNTVETVSTLTMTGLLNRLHSPHLLAMSALSHHTHGSNNTLSYHTLAIHAPPPDTVAWYRAHVTAGCLGFCTGKTAEQAAARQKYTPDIRIISGHCDFGFSPTGRPEDFGLATLLVKEAFGTVSNQQTGFLNQASMQLFTTLTSDSTRQGTALPALPTAN